MAHDQFFSYADAAMHLHCLLCDPMPKNTDTGLRCADTDLAIPINRCRDSLRGHRSGGLKFKNVHHDVGVAMLQGLKGGERLAELLAGHQIGARNVAKRPSDAESLRAQCGYAGVEHRLQRRPRIRIRPSQSSIERHHDFR